jgi:hypothetical protein
MNTHDAKGERKNNKLNIKDKDITNNDDKDENLKKVFFIIYLLTVSKKISESNYISILKQINGIGFEVNCIKDVEPMIFYLENNNFKVSYIITMLLYLRYDIYDSINDLIENYTELKRFIYSNKNEKRVNDIINIKNYLEDKVIVIKSFVKLGQPPNENDELILKDEPKMDRKTIRHHYNISHREEIINRLFQLREHFDLDILQYMEVELVMYGELIDYKLRDLHNYYTECVSCIKKKLYHWISLCSAYLDSEISYLKSLKRINLNRRNNLININISTLELITNR